MTNLHFVSDTRKGVLCFCGEKSSHKVGEEIPFDDPELGNRKFGDKNIKFHRHNFTAYVCCFHFKMIMGNAVFCNV